MTEKEKMLKQMLYDANYEELSADRVAAKDLCYDYNQLRPSDVEGQKKVMKKLLGKTHGDFYIVLNLLYRSKIYRILCGYIIISYRIYLILLRIYHSS